MSLALSHYFPVPAGAWRFARDHNGKPFIASPEVSPAAQFSVSHTEGLIACLITLSEAAVDVEKIEYDQDLQLVARRSSFSRRAEDLKQSGGDGLGSIILRLLDTQRIVCEGSRLRTGFEIERHHY